jgi:hypothetical protein
MRRAVVGAITCVIGGMAVGLVSSFERLAAMPLMPPPSARYGSKAPSMRSNEWFSIIKTMM